jgi:hypothetical protein
VLQGRRQAVIRTKFEFRFTPQKEIPIISPTALRRVLNSAPTIEEIRAAFTLLRQLPPLLRNPLSYEEAVATHQNLRAHREENFLTLVRHAVYAQAGCPYRWLLELAGCEYGDLEQLVRLEGLEGALAELFHQGVYLTVDELKGHVPVVRGSASLHVEPRQLRNPALVPQIMGHSSASRGSGSVVALDLDLERERQAPVYLAFESLGGMEWEHARWSMPGGSLGVLLRYAVGGPAYSVWFTMVDPASPKLSPRYQWSIRFALWASRIGGAPIPRPRYASLDHPMPILGWMQEQLREGKVPHLTCPASAGVRLAQAASAQGMDLAGARLMVTGEPLTQARRRTIEEVGARCMSCFAASEVGNIGLGCAAPEAADDAHLLEGVLALIQPGVTGSARGLPPTALLLTSLSSAARLILINASLGDQAVVGKRECGCPLKVLGCTHMHTIRSFEKLTTGGMTFLDAEIIPILEEVLPDRFGGGSTHYQLVESEAVDGAAELRLLIHPSVGDVDEDAVTKALLTAIGERSEANHLMVLAWRAANVLRVERKPPLTTAGGKILHLHSVR